MSNAIAIIHKAEILAQVADGVRLSDIAKQYGITQPALSQDLNNDPDYQQAVLAGIESKLDKREVELECASDQLMFARSRELLSHTRWLAERLCREKYGKDTVAITQSTPVFNVIIQSSQSQTPKLIISQEQEVGGVKIMDKG